VHEEDLAAAQLEAGVAAVVLELSAARLHEPVQHHGVAQVVAVDHVHRQSRPQRCLQGLRADHVAAVHHGLGARGGGFAHGAGQGVGAVVAVGDDADLHRGIIRVRAAREQSRSAYRRISRFRGGERARMLA
jgi:hypothetical protein